MLTTYKVTTLLTILGFESKLMVATGPWDVSLPLLQAQLTIL